MRMRTLVLVLLVLGVVGYVVVFRRGDVAKSAKGYAAGDSPKAAAEMFRKALQEREYAIAADYCTAGMAGQLRRSADPATEYATALDNLTYQMKERGLVRDEVKLVFQALDPFPKDVTITVGKESAETAEAALVFAAPALRGDSPSAGSWKLRPELFQTFSRGLRYTTPTTAVVPMRKEADGWKLDFPADSALTARVTYLTDKYKNYVNPFKLVTQEVKNDPTTKENVTGRLKTLIEEAARE